MLRYNDRHFPKLQTLVLGFRALDPLETATLTNDRDHSISRTNARTRQNGKLLWVTTEEKFEKWQWSAPEGQTLKWTEGIKDLAWIRDDQL